MIRLGVLLVLLSTLGLAASAAAFQGKVQFHCTPQVAQQVDPLADYGISPSPHLHTAAGAKGTFSANETLAILDGATLTSCALGSDLSQLWAPTPLKADGTQATIKDIAYYLINENGQTISPISSFNPNLRFLVGRPKCTTLSCHSASFFCLGNHIAFTKIPTTAQCPSGGYQETMHVALPGQCWDGLSLGEGFGATTAVANIFYSTNACPVDTVPDIVMTMTVDQGGVGGYLSSDYVPSEGIDNRTTCSGCSAHFDYAFNFQPAALQAIIDQCMYQPKINQAFLTCAEGPPAPGARGQASIYLNDPNTDRPEDGQLGEPYHLVTS